SQKLPDVPTGKLCAGTERAAASLAVDEEAERMACRVEHHPQASRIAICGLMRRLAASSLDDPLDAGLKVIHQDLEVHHLRLVPMLLRPGRRLVRAFGLNVQAH